MDIQISNISIQGDSATADAEFRPRSGAPSGAAMQVTYRLDKQSGTWSVTSTGTMGGAISHPASGTNPHMPTAQPDPHALPDIHEIMQSLDQKRQPAPGSPPPGTGSHP